MTKQVPKRDPNTSVAGLPPSILAKITQLIDASMDLAWTGAQEPDVAQKQEDYFHTCRYELERTIKTCLEK